MTSGDASGRDTLATTSALGIDTVVAKVSSGEWLAFLPPRLREPMARVGLQVLVAALVLGALAPFMDARGEAWIESTFARTLAALAATRGLDSAISLAQSSEVSFSFGPGGSLGIGQALDPVNDLVEQYGALLLTSTTALGVQRLGMQIGKALGWWLFVPAVVAALLAAACGDRTRPRLLAWSRRLFGLALFARLALPVAGWVDSWVADRFLETNYQQASAAVTATTAKLEQAEEVDAKRPWYERYNPIDAIGDRAQQMYVALAAVGESIVNLAIYFTISTILLPLGTLWLFSKTLGVFFSGRPDR